MNFPFQAIQALVFQPKPHPVPASLRPIYRIAQILLVLKINCRQNTASLLKLQFFNWLLKSVSLQESVETLLENQSVITLDRVHIDPMVNLALKYAYAENLISITNASKYKLTAKGDQLSSRILQNDNDQLVLAKESKLLRQIGHRLSEVKLRRDLL